MASKELNYQIGDSTKKTLYMDGNERAGVVDYRMCFLNEMEIYLKMMHVWVGDEMETRIMPEILEETRPLIMVIHDESCFKSNDGGKTG